MATYNVKDFGALGNGVANDRAAIQKALDKAYADGGGVVYIPEGTYAIDGGSATRTYAGLQVRSNVTIVGDGMGETIIKVMDGNSVGFTGMIRTPVGEETRNVHIEGITLDGNRANTTGKVDGFFTGTEPGANTSVYDISLNKVEIRNASGYGFDPHEQSTRVTIENSIAHHNGLDGFTLDFLIDSTIRNNISYANDRHGFNIVTQTQNTLFENNVGYDNGSTGLVVQRGSFDVPSPFGITIRGGEFYGNLDGMLIKMSNDINIENVRVYDNDREGIKIYGSSDVQITGSTIENNSQLGNNLYAEVYINQYADIDVTGRTFIPTGNVITDNIIRSNGAIHSSYGIRESLETTDSLISGNTFEGTFVRAQTLTGPQVRIDMPDLVAPTNDFYFQISNSAYVDIDPGDAVSLDVELVNAQGQLVNGGALPSWMQFDDLRKMIIGDPPANGTFYLRVSATDKGGNTEYDLFKLTVTGSGAYNVQIGAPPPPPAATIFNVKDFGAVGNGVTNDREAIQAAVDAAAQVYNGVVYMPAGAYGIGDDGLGKTYAGIQLPNGVTLRGAGMGTTTIKVLDGTNVDITGVVRTIFDVPNHHVTMEDFTIDGNRANNTGKVDGVFVGTAPGSTEQDSDIVIRRVEVMNASGYGFDPHEQTIRLTMEGNVAHHNTLDGFALDYLIDSTIRNNVAYENGRHGFNVITTTHNTLLENNDAYNNGGNGITVQRGSENIPSPYDVTIRGGDVYGNSLAGVLVKYSNDVTIENLNIHDNGREGVKLDGSDDVIFRNNNIGNNSQSLHDGYNEVYVAQSTDTTTGQTFVSDNFEITGNTIYSTALIKASWLIREIAQATSGYVANNTFNGAGVDGISRTGPQIRTETPDLIAPRSAFHYIIPQTAIVDTDPGDAITVKLELVNASGALVNGGALPSWLTFNAGNWTINGNTTTTQTIYLRLSATDASGDVEYDRFSLTIRGTGPYNTNAGNVAGPPPPPPPPGTGTAGNDTLTGTAGDDTLSGLGGNDSIFGGAGADTMTGGDGNDVFNVDNVGDNVVESTNLGAGGIDRVESTVSVAALWSEVENLTLLGSADLSAVGNGNANLITGNSGNNTLDGGLGNDTLAGGAGNDTYYINVTGDVVQEGSGAGTDTVNAGFSYTLASNLENLVLGASAPNGTGNSLNNVITGNGLGNKLTGAGGNDTLDGGAGADTLRGDAGDDLYIVDDAADNVAESSSAGNDTVNSSVSFAIGSNIEKLVLTGSAAINGTGNSGANSLVGNSGNNSLSGTSGNDTLVGGAGADTLSGGGNTDRFVFTSGADSSEAAPDLIVDLKKSESDVVDLSGVDANSNAAGNQAFVWAASFTGVAGQMVGSYNAGTNQTTLRMDIDGDGAGDDMVILLTGNVDSTFGFVL